MREKLEIPRRCRGFQRCTDSPSPGPVKAREKRWGRSRLTTATSDVQSRSACFDEYNPHQPDCPHSNQKRRCCEHGTYTPTTRLSYVQALSEGLPCHHGLSPSQHSCVRWRPSDQRLQAPVPAPDSHVCQVTEEN